MRIDNIINLIDVCEILIRANPQVSSSTLFKSKSLNMTDRTFRNQLYYLESKGIIKIFKTSEGKSKGVNLMIYLIKKQKLQSFLKKLEHDKKRNKA